MSYTSQSKALAIIPKFSGFLSFVGSSWILQDIARSTKKRSQVYHRLILGMSAFDIMASIVNILSTWPIPSGTPGVFGAVGTTQTCTAQGFFNETGNITTPLYNLALCLYCVLMIRSSWTERQIKKIEPLFHLLPLSVGLTMGLIGLPFNLYNNSGWLCWIAPYPSNCHHDPDVPCERGEHAGLFRWIHYAIIWSAISFVTVGMCLIYLEVRKTENVTRRYNSNYIGTSSAAIPGAIGAEAQSGSGGGGGGRKSRRVANQAMLFVGAMYLTWIFTTLTRIFQTVLGKTYFSLLILMAIFFPLQGFFNVIIYLRPHYVDSRRRYPDRSFWRVCFEVLRGRDANQSNPFDTEHSTSLSFWKQISNLVEETNKRMSLRRSIVRIDESISNDISDKPEEEKFEVENEDDDTGEEKREDKDRGEFPQNSKLEDIIEETNSC